MKKIIPILIIACLIIGIILIFRGKKDDSRHMIFYYKNDCPHCKDTEEYFKDKGIERKYDLVKKETTADAATKAELISYAAKCGVASTNVGVPFLWNGEGCNMGKNSIIKYFDDLMKKDEKK